MQDDKRDNRPLSVVQSCEREGAGNSSKAKAKREKLWAARREYRVALAARAKEPTK